MVKIFSPFQPGYLVPHALVFRQCRLKFPSFSLSSSTVFPFLLIFNMVSELKIVSTVHTLLLIFFL